MNDAKALKNATGRFAKELGAAAEIIKRMHLGKDPAAVETLLAVKAGVTLHDTRFLNALGELLQLDSELLDNGASPETLRLVSQASDEDLRAFAARRKARRRGWYCEVSASRIPAQDALVSGPFTVFVLESATPGW